MSRCRWSQLVKCEVYSGKKKKYTRKSENILIHTHTQLLSATLFFTFSDGFAATIALH